MPCYVSPFVLLFLCLFTKLTTCSKVKSLKVTLFISDVSPIELYSVLYTMSTIHPAMEKVGQEGLFCYLAPQSKIAGSARQGSCGAFNLEHILSIGKTRGPPTFLMSVNCPDKEDDLLLTCNLARWDESEMVRSFFLATEYVLFASVGSFFNSLRVSAAPAREFSCRKDSGFFETCVGGAS